jgi:hypothetical protein
MAEGHGRDAWSRMSELLSMIYNANRDPSKCRALKSKDFNPYECQRPQAIEVTKENIGELRDIFARFPKRKT